MRNQISSFLNCIGHELKGKLSFLALLILFGIIFLYALSDNFISLLPFFSAAALIYPLSKIASNTIGLNKRFPAVVFFAYLAISLVGMMEVVDNINNFLTPFGKHADDSKFFERTINLLYLGQWDEQSGLFEIVIALWGSFFKLIRTETLDLLDLLPLCWLFGAFAVGLCDELTQRATGCKPPLWLIYATTVCNFKFMDAVIHLYRDGLILVFFLVSLIYLSKHQHIKAIFTSLPVFILRGANFFLFLVFFICWTTRNKLSSRFSFYLLFGTILIATMAILPKYGNQILAFSSGIQNVGNVIGLSSWDFKQNIQFRQEFISEQAAAGSNLQKSLSTESYTAFAMRPIIFTFFPVRFWPIKTTGESMSTYAASKSAIGGIFIINIFVWITVATWIFVAPFLITGIGNAFCGRKEENVIIVYYILSLALVSFVSMQMRHSLSFTILNLTVCTIGHRFLVVKKRTVTYAFISIIVALCLIYYNI